MYSIVWPSWFVVLLPLSDSCLWLRAVQAKWSLGHCHAAWACLALPPCSVCLPLLDPVPPLAFMTFWSRARFMVLSQGFGSLWVSLGHHSDRGCCCWRWAGSGVGWGAGVFTGHKGKGRSCAANMCPIHSRAGTLLELRKGQVGQD